ncbi:MAG: UDP binding domain-containing protein, partial [Terriglobales bacterium]
DAADAVLILTEWPQFRSLDWKAMARRMTRRLVMDGRNLFSAHELSQLGFEYVSIGRPGEVRSQPVAATP